MHDGHHRRPRFVILLTSSLVCGIFALAALVGLLYGLFRVVAGAVVAAWGAA